MGRAPLGPYRRARSTTCKACASKAQEIAGCDQKNALLVEENTLLQERINILEKMVATYAAILRLQDRRRPHTDIEDDWIPTHPI